MRPTTTGLCAAVAAAATLTGGLSARQASLHEALDLYNRGEHAAALGLAEPGALTARTLLDLAGEWLQAAPADQHPRRRLVAAAFTLDLVWNSTRNEHNAFSLEGDWTRGLRRPERLPASSFAAQVPVVAWGCAWVMGLERGHPAERWWWLASVGALQDARAWDALLGGSTLRITPAPEGRMAEELARGHLAHARERIPDEPRWHLARVIATSRKRLGPVNWFLDRAGARRVDVLRDERHERSEAIAGLIGDFEKLAREQPTLAGEVELHTGYLELLLRRWRKALERFERARPLLDEPFLLAALDYFSG